MKRERLRSVPFLLSVRKSTPLQTHITRIVIVIKIKFNFLGSG